MSCHYKGRGEDRDVDYRCNEKILQMMDMRFFTSILFMILFMVLFWGLIIGGIVFLVRSISP